MQRASRLYLPGPVTELYPHLLHHACATHNYERGMTLWEVQKLLGHEWTTTTVRYLATAQADPEQACREAAGRAAQRLVRDAGSLRLSGICGGWRPSRTSGGRPICWPRSGGWVSTPR
ncbi:tyrosine-type recombinase/integrase [Amycolatopsis thermoflava]|uniref:tyrosine-type recombinase/integrase n=1 Tax=Amycolatopsis thermoflava TaxID=84480 RepID=UPI001AE003FA